MRTSPTQFQVMVEFMERHGDLNKPADGPHGRLTNHKNWEELARVLNMDPSGCSRNVEQWKKVWSDLKSNTKRKYAKIDKAAQGTGGGPACNLSLTELEQRVLHTMNPQSATGLHGVQEVFYNADPQPVPAGQSTPTRDVTHTIENAAVSTPFETAVAATDLAEEPTRHHATSPPTIRITSPRQRSQTTARRHTILSPRRRRQRSSFRRTSASEEFIQSDNGWRNLATEFVTESIRLRSHELESQMQWQALFARALDLFSAYIEEIRNRRN